ncbi:MAG: hypothetical protein JRH11_14575 [Deltaproteobacteria bacterium]|nr:hypothetical protein [Deltaproteobacteria bacterium]
MTRHLTLLSLALLLLPLALACEPVYGELGQLLDPSTPFDGAAETYMLGDDTKTEMVIFGAQDERNIGDIAYASIIENGDIVLLTGKYRAPEAGVVRASFDIIYEYEHEYDTPASMRIGSTTTLLDVPIEYTGAILANQDEITLETGDGPQTFLRVGTLLDRIDPTVPEDQVLLARLVNYAIIVSLARVVGFGGAGLTMYVGRVGEFQGFQSGRQEVLFAELLSPKATMTYIDYTDLTGFHYDGTYTSRTDISATGDMVGAVDFTIAEAADAPPTFAGTLRYEGVVINNGIPNEGFYRFNLDDGSSFDVSSIDFNNLNLGALFR